MHFRVDWNTDRGDGAGICRYADGMFGTVRRPEPSLKPRLRVARLCQSLETKAGQLASQAPSSVIESDAEGPKALKLSGLHDGSV